MLGESAEERARTMEVLGLADEATSLFGLACHKGSAMFVLLEETDARAGRLALEGCEKVLGVLERGYYGQDGRFVKERSEDGEDEVDVTIADVVLFTLLQFAEVMYKKDLTQGLDGLKRFYEGFGRRGSARVSEDMYPEDIRKIASHWLPETKSWFGSLKEGAKLVWLYLRVCGGLLRGLMRWGK